MAQSETPELRDASWSELSTELSQQISRLVRDEIQLAQVEIKEKGKRLGLGAGLMSAGGLLAVFGFGCLVATAVLALDLAWAAWLAALAVGCGLLVAAGVAVVSGRGQLRRATPPVPREAIASAKEDLETLKGRQ
jgi:uncharacterized membrane protein YqjE